MEEVETSGGARDPERIPDRVANGRREPPATTEAKRHDIEVGSAGEGAEQAVDDPRRPRLGLRPRRDVKPDAHAPPRSLAAGSRRLSST